MNFLDITIDITKNYRWPVFFAGCQKLKQNSRLLETGRIRTASKAHFEGDGWSTIFFGLQSNINEIISIDINPATEQVVKDILGKFSDRIKFYNQDSLKAFEKLTGVFDAVLLDSGEDQLLHKQELVYCLKHGFIKEGTILFLDDNNSKTRWTYLALKRNTLCAREIINNHQEQTSHLCSVWIVEDPKKMLELFDGGH